MKSKISCYLSKIESKEAIPVNYLPENKFKKFKKLPIVSKLAHEHTILDIIIPMQITYDTRHIRSCHQDLIFDNPTGILFDRLRNQLGLIYSLHYEFNMPSNMLDIQMICDEKNVDKILDETRNIFSSPDLVFDPRKVEIVKDLTVK